MDLNNSTTQILTAILLGAPGIDHLIGAITTYGMYGKKGTQDTDRARALVRHIAETFNERTTLLIPVQEWKTSKMVETFSILAALHKHWPTKFKEVLGVRAATLKYGPVRAIRADTAREFQALVVPIWGAPESELKLTTRYSKTIVEEAVDTGESTNELYQRVHALGRRLDEMAGHVIKLQDQVSKLRPWYKAHVQSRDLGFTDTAPPRLQPPEIPPVMGAHSIPVPGIVQVTSGA
jgi:hypothetical protein